MYVYMYRNVVRTPEYVTLKTINTNMIHTYTLAHIKENARYVIILFIYTYICITNNEKWQSS